MSHLGSCQNWPIPAKDFLDFAEILPIFWKPALKKNYKISGLLRSSSRFLQDSRRLQDAPWFFLKQLEPYEDLQEFLKFRYHLGTCLLVQLVWADCTRALLSFSSSFMSSRSVPRRFLPSIMVWTCTVLPGIILLSPFLVEVASTSCALWPTSEPLCSRESYSLLAEELPLIVHMPYHTIPYHGSTLGHLTKMKSWLLVTASLEKLINCCKGLIKGHISCHHFIRTNY